MSKLTINVVLQVLRLVIACVAKAIRLIYSIQDIVDDGCLNASVPRPDWMITLQSALTSLQTLSGHLSSVEDEVYGEAN